MLLYFVGQDAALSTTVIADSGMPATGALSVVLTVTSPAGAVSTPATTSAGQGVYTATVPALTAAGVWLFRWTATGIGTGFVDEGQFQVRPTGAQQIVDLPSVKLHLNIPLTDVSNDGELQGFILAAGELARDVVGPVLAEARTEWHNGGSTTVSLDSQPVASVQSVTEYVAATSWDLTEQPLGTSTDSYGYTVDLDLGVIVRRAVGDAIPFPRGTKNVRVVYTAGRGGMVTWAIRLGALELIRHLWQLTQQGGRLKWAKTGALDTDSSIVPMGFALPQRVLDLWKPEKRPPGIA